MRQRRRQQPPIVVLFLLLCVIALAESRVKRKHHRKSADEHRSSHGQSFKVPPPPPPPVSYPDYSQYGPDPLDAYLSLPSDHDDRDYSLPPWLSDVVERYLSKRRHSNAQVASQNTNPGRVCYARPTKQDILYEHLVNGLPENSKVGRQRVVIVGAGISGLTAAQMLKDAGHDVVILESTNRVGGRIQTYRDLKDGWSTEVGPMRIPHHHRYVLHLVKRFGISTDKFLNDKADDHYFIRGKKVKQDSIGAINLHFFQEVFQLAPGEESKPPGELYREAMRRPTQDFQDMEFSDFVAKYDKYSLKDYLKEAGGLSPGAVEIIGVFLNMEAFLNQALIEAVMDDCVFDNTELTKVKGGFDLIARGFLPSLGANVQYNSMVTKIRQNAAGVNIEVDCTGVHCYDISSAHAADHAVVTTTAPVALGIEFEPMLSRNKSSALRAVHYMASSKVIMIFHSPWWLTGDQPMGGVIISDLPLKTIYYPTEPNKNGYGILLASYTWGGDSNRLLGLDQEEIFEEMMEGLALIHGTTFEKVRAQFMKGVVKHWSLDPNYLGAFAAFHKYQTVEYQDQLAEAEGRVHFSGEHTETPHGWMDTAVRSGARVATEIHLGKDWDKYLVGERSSMAEEARRKKRWS